MKGIAADLGISRGALAGWVRRLGAGTATLAAVPTGTAAGVSSGPEAGARSGLVGPVRGESPAARIARLQARVAQLEAETTKLSTEREILRSAAKYFAGETNW